MNQQWSEQRERQVLAFFHQHRNRPHYLASCRCPHDGRILGAVSRLPDGMWLWQAGLRLAPAASRRELEAFYVDCLDETERSAWVHQEAAQYAHEELGQQGRVGKDPTVKKLIIDSPDEAIRVADRQSPESRPGVPLTELITCGCRKQHLLPVLGLVYAGYRVSLGRAQPGTHIPPMRPRTIEEIVSKRRRPSGDSVYSFMDGKMVVNLHER